MANLLKLASSFCYRHYLPHLLLTLAFCLFSENIVSFRNLDLSQSARVLEMYAVWIGIILLTPLFMPEQNEVIRQLIKTKKTPMWISYVIRVMLGIGAIAIAALYFLITLKENGSEVLFAKMWLGLFCEAFFLGSMGFFVSAVTNQVIIGYMAPVIYFAVNVGQRKVFGKLGLFQMTFIREYDFWYWMLGGGIILVIFGILMRECIKR